MSADYEQEVALATWHRGYKDGALGVGPQELDDEDYQNGWMEGEADAENLKGLEAAFDYLGGRGVDLAEEIDNLRAKMPEEKGLTPG